MIETIPLETVEISVGDVSSWQQTVAWVMLAVVVAVIIAGRLAMRYSWLEDDQRRHLRAIRPTIAGATWHRVTITADDDRESRYQTVATAIRGDLDTASGGVRSAVADLHAWAQRYTPAEIPALAIRGAVEGLIVLTLGLLIAAPVTWWEDAFSTPSAGESAGGTVAALTDAAATLGTGLVWFLETTVPAGGTIARLTLAVAVLTARFIAGQWLPLGVVLVLGAVLVAYLDYLTVEDLSVVLYPNRRLSGAAAVAILGFAWAVAAVPTIAGQLLAAGLERTIGTGASAALVGSVVGALAGLVVLGVAGYLAVMDLHKRLYRRQSDPNRTPHFVAVYLLARKCLGLAFVVALPVLVYLAAQAVLSGALVRPLAALSTAPLWGRLALLAAPTAMLAYLATHAEGRTADHLRSFRRWFASRLIQSAGFARGVPIVAVILGFLIGWAYVSPTAALIAAAIAGVGSRSLLLVYEKGRVRAGKGLVRSGPFLLGGTVFAIVAWQSGAILGAGMMMLVVTGMAMGARRLWRRYGLGLGEPERESKPPTDQVVEIPDAPARDADGELIFIARVDGRPLAARDPETLFRDIQVIVNTRFESGETPTLLSHEYYTDLIGRGVVDETSVAKAVRGDLATRATATVRDKGGVDTDVLEEELADEYPQRFVEPTLEWLEQRQDIGVRDGQYVPVN